MWEPLCGLAKPRTQVGGPRCCSIAANLMTTTDRTRIFPPSLLDSLSSDAGRRRAETWVELERCTKALLNAVRGLLRPEGLTPANWWRRWSRSGASKRIVDCFTLAVQHGPALLAESPHLARFCCPALLIIPGLLYMGEDWPQLADWLKWQGGMQNTVEAILAVAPLVSPSLHEDLRQAMRVFMAEMYEAGGIGIVVSLPRRTELHCLHIKYEMDAVRQWLQEEPSTRIGFDDEDSPVQLWSVSLTYLSLMRDHHAEGRGAVHQNVPDDVCMHPLLPLLLQSFQLGVELLRQLLPGLRDHSGLAFLYTDLLGGPLRLLSQGLGQLGLGGLPPGWVWQLKCTIQGLQAAAQPMGLVQPMAGGCGAASADDIVAIAAVDDASERDPILVARRYLHGIAFNMLSFVFLVGGGASDW